MDDIGYDVSSMIHLQCSSPVLIAHTSLNDIKLALTQLVTEGASAIVQFGANLPMARFSDLAENSCLGVFRGQELESGVRFPKFSSESGEIGQWKFPGFRAIFRISGGNFIKPTPDSDSWPKTTYMGIFSCPLGHFLKNVNFLDFPGFPRFRKIYLLLQYSS